MSLWLSSIFFHINVVTKCTARLFIFTFCRNLWNLHKRVLSHQQRSWGCNLILSLFLAFFIHIDIFTFLWTTRLHWEGIWLFLGFDWLASWINLFWRIVLWFLCFFKIIIAIWTLTLSLASSSTTPVAWLTTLLSAASRNRSSFNYLSHTCLTCSG